MDKEGRKKLFDGIGMFAAIITVIAYLLLVINAQWPFLDGVPTVYNILTIVRHYAPLVVVAIVGLEYVAGKNILIRLLYYAIVALIVISMFFPSTWNELVLLVE